MNNIKEIKKDYNKESFQMEYTYSYEFNTRESKLGEGDVAKGYLEDYIELLTNVFRDDLIKYIEDNK